MDELDDALAAFESPAEHISGIEFDLDNSPLPCGFKDFEKNRYLRQGKSDLVVIAARPSHGKTALALQLAMNVARRVGPVVFFSLEMDKRQLKQRAVALESETNIGKLHTLSEARRQKLNDLFSTMPLYIDDTANLNVNILMSRAMAFKKSEPLSLVIVDYLQIVATDAGRSKAEEVAEVSAKLKQLAKDLSVPVLTLAQMNRAIEVRQGTEKRTTRPLMSDLADSAGIEKWADLVLFLHRPYLINKSRPDEVDVFAAKNRHGDTQDFTLGFKGELTKFSDFEGGL